MQPDVAAPGVSILAAITPSYPIGDKGYAMISGTSMATPHVAGIVALIKALHPTWSPAAIKSAIVTSGTFQHIPIKPSVTLDFLSLYNLK